jgi:hypothetical protein
MTCSNVASGKTHVLRGENHASSSPAVRFAKRVLRQASVVACCCSLAACFTSVGKWTYPSGRYPTTVCERAAPASVFVEPFIDLRSDTNRSWIPWAYIPLSPCGWVHFDRPEATERNDYTPDYRVDPCVDLARSIALELQREGLVEKAEFSEDGKPTAAHTHLLRGKLRAFFVHESRWTYCVSVYAWILWSLAAPVGHSENGFCAELELVDLRDGKVVWQGSVFDADDHLEGFYYGPEWFRFAWMWERRLREKMPEIAAALGTKPAPLPPVLSEELRTAPAPVMPKCLGIDSNSYCTAR